MTKRSKGQHIGGGKINGNHSSVIDAAEEIIRFLKKQKAVNNIGLGQIIQGLPSGVPRRIKFHSIEGCLKLTIRGSVTQQEVKIYTQDTRAVENSLRAQFGKTFQFKVDTT